MPAGHAAPARDSIPAPREELSARFRKENLVRRIWLFFGRRLICHVPNHGDGSPVLEIVESKRRGEVEWGVTVLSQHPTPRPAHTRARGRCRSAVLLPRETWEGGRARQRQQAHLSSGLDRSRFEILLTLHFQI